MTAENDLEVETKELLFPNEPPTQVETGDKLKNHNSHNDCCINENKNSTADNNLEEQTIIPKSESSKISIWKNKTIYVNRSLIPLRIAQFLWFAGGGLCIPFFLLMLTHRGLPMTEFSSLFSMLFLFQLGFAYVCGIIADKLGNAKPVLLFQMFCVIAIILSLLLAPHARDKSCLEFNVNLTCFHIYNDTSYLEYCSNLCSSNNTDYLTREVKKNFNSNDSITFLQGNDVLSHNKIFEEGLFPNNTAIFCNEICSCLEASKHCSSKLKAGFKVLYCSLGLAFFSVWSTSFRFIDFASLNVAKQNNSDFGSERFFGFLGILVITFLSNFVLNIKTSGTRNYYDNIFWFSVILKILAAISACNIKKFILPPGLKLTKKTLSFITDIEIVSIILVTFVAGTTFCLNEFFHLWFLDNLKASKLTIGIHIMTESLYGVPMLLTSKWWLKKLKRTTVVIISLLSYAINDISYSFLYYPWISLLIEITKAFSFHLFWAALVIHCRAIAPEGFSATVNAVLGAVHFGIGRSVGVSVGGYLMNTYGPRTSYRIVAGFCLTSAILYSMFLYLKLLFYKKDNKNQSIDPEEMKSMKENEA